MNNHSFSYLNPKCEARDHTEGGCGVFANAVIVQGELVSLWGGRIVRNDELDRFMPRFTQRVLQVDEDLYLLTAEEKESNDCFNHSCDPNLGFLGQIGLVALRNIKSGEELMFDYAMSDGGPYDEFECNCESPNCRRKITGNDWKLPELWNKYKGFFSPYLARRIENLPMKIRFPIRIYLVALILRLIPIMLTRGLGIGLDDMFQYDMLAGSLASGDGYRWYAPADLERLKTYINFDLTAVNGYDPEHGLYTSFRAPLYPTFLAIIYLFSGTGFSRLFAARLLQAILLGAPLAPLTYFIAKHLSSPSSDETGQSSEKTARTSAWIVACYPMLLVYPLGLGTENPFFVLLLLSFFFLLKSIERPSTSNFLLSGLFLALTALTRSVVLPFAGLAMAYLIYLHGKRSLLIGVVFMLIITPWMIRNSLLHNKLTGIETSMGYNMYIGYYPQGNGSFIFGPSLDLLAITDDAERDHVGMQKAIEFIREQPERFVPLAVNRLGFFFGLEKRTLMYYYANNIMGHISNPLLPALGFILLLPFVIISVFASLGFSLLRWNSKTILLLLLLIGYLLPHVFILSEDRFHLALIPFFAVLAAGFWEGGFQAVSIRWQESDTGKWMVAFAILGVCLLCLNWGFELSRDANKIAALLGPNGNQTYPPY